MAHAFAIIPARAAFSRLSRQLLLASALAAAPTIAAAQDAKPEVVMSVRMRSLTHGNDHDATFKASFLLSVTTRNVVVGPANIVLLNEVANASVGPPIVQKNANGGSYQLYRIKGVFHYGRQSSANLLQGGRDLDVMIALDGPALADARLSAAAGDAAAATVELADGSTLRAQALVTEPAAAADEDPLHPGSAFGERVFVARSRVQTEAESPKDWLGAALGPARWWLALVAAAGLALAWLGKRPVGFVGARLMLKLAAGTVLLYELDRLLLQACAARLSGAAIRTLLDLSGLLWWFAPIFWLHAVLSTFAWRRIAQTTGTPVPGITRTLVPLVGLLLSLTLALHFVWGYSIGAVWAASGVLSLVLGFALQGLILDAFAGIFLNLERPFKLLQWVSITEYQGREYEGQVIDINWRSTRLLTRANNIVSVPNSNLTRAMIVNYAEPTSPSRLELALDLSAQVPIALARRLIVQGMRAAARDGRILAHPEPQVAVVETLAEGRTGYRGYFYADLNLVAATVAVTDAMEAVIELFAASGIHGCVQAAKEPAGEQERASGQGADASLSAQPMAAEVALIQSTWAQVVPIADTAAQLFYQRLFELDPELRRLFRTDAATQRRKLIGMLTIVVQGLGRMDRLMSTVEELGLRHAGYGVQTRHFDTVGAALLWTLGQGLGPAFTPEVEQAWARVYRVLAEAMTGANAGSTCSDFAP